MPIFHIVLAQGVHCHKSHLMLTETMTESKIHDLKRLLKDSCLALALPLNFFTLMISPSLVIATFSGSPSYPESQITCWPALILKMTAAAFFGNSSFRPPWNTVISWILAGKGPQIEIMLLECRAITTFYAAPDH
jgi:hypothetical protein